MTKTNESKTKWRSHGHIFDSCRETVDMLTTEQLNDRASKVGTAAIAHALLAVAEAIHALAEAVEYK